MALVQVKVPDIGDFKDVAVIELLVKPGDRVAADQSLITVESDKASMEIPSSAAGVVKELQVKLGDKVSQGSAVLLLEAEGAEEKTASSQVQQGIAATESVAAAPAAAAAAPAPAQATAVQVRVPDIGDFKDVSVIEVFIKPGDSVKLEQSLITVESDKASMEIPSSAAGVVKELKVKLGDKVNMGDLIAVLEGVAASASASASTATVAPAAAAAAPAATPAAAPAATPAPAAAPGGERPAINQPQDLPHASPSVRKFARELGVPLAEVKGSGPKGRITLQDVQQFTQAVMAGSVQTQAQAARGAGGTGGGAGLDLLPWPKVDFAKFGPVERKALPRIKKISGANLARNWVMIPHVTNNDEADITELEAFRVQTNKENEKSGAKVTMLAFVIKAVVAALKKFPDFNASLDGDELVYKQYFHIGFAADTPNGLVVPVIKDVDKKGLKEISQELTELSKKAREGKLKPQKMQGACFTISSLGGIGGTGFTPIVNAPEVAILGVCKSQMKPVWNGSAFEPRLMCPLSLSFDHRVIDGAAGMRFTVFLANLLKDFRRITL